MPRVWAVRAFVAPDGDRPNEWLNLRHNMPRGTLGLPRVGALLEAGRRIRQRAAWQDNPETS